MRGDPPTSIDSHEPWAWLFTTSAELFVTTKSVILNYQWQRQWIIFAEISFISHSNEK